jgi:hypothetical protein
MPIFLEADGGFNLNFYWFKGFRKLLVQSQKSFQKPLGMTVFPGYLHKISSGFQKLLTWR